MRALLLFVVAFGACSCAATPALCIRSPDSRNPPRLALPVGERVRVAAGRLALLDECNYAPPPGVRWGSSDPAVLVIDTAGVVRGIRPGRAEVVAAAAGAEARLPMRVVPRVARIALSPVDTTFAVGDTVLFRAIAYGADGRPLADVPLDLRATASRASYPHGRPAIWGMRPIGPGARRRVPNALAVVAFGAGAGYVVAAVTGRADSVPVRAVAR